MTFTLLNVQGLVTKNVNKLELADFKTYFNNSDFIFFTETWSSEEVDLAVEGFINYSLHRTDLSPHAKRKSGGICCYIKNECADAVKLVKTHSDDIMWLRFAGRLFNRTDDLFIALCYLIPEGSSRMELADVVLYDRLLQDILNFLDETNDRCCFLCLGDFNSRVGHLPDFVEHDNYDPYVHVLPDDYTNDMFLPRNSQDTIVNRNGKLLIDFCKESGLRIINGRIGEDAEVGKYTFIGSQGKSVVDYVIVSPSLMELFKTFKVEEPNLFSDHCCIRFSVESNLYTQEFVCDNCDNVHSGGEKVSYRYIWDNTKINDFKTSLSQEDIVCSLNSLTLALDNLDNITDIDNNLDSFFRNNA